MIIPLRHRPTLVVGLLAGLLLTAILGTHAQSTQPPQSESGTDDAKELSVKVQVYNTFIWDLGVDHDSKVGGRGGPFIDWEKANQRVFRLTDEEWNDAYQIFLNAYDWKTGRVKLPAGNDSIQQPDSVQPSTNAGVQGSTTLPSALAVYNYTIQALRYRLDENAFHRLDRAIDEDGHGYFLRHSPPVSNPAEHPTTTGPSNSQDGGC